MISALIRIRKNNYYLKINDNSFSIILANNFETRVLSKEEAIDLINSLFVGNFTFKEHLNDYDIYLDEIGNKRYFKDNKEDLNMFFKNNGHNYIMYDKLLENTNTEDQYFKIFRLKIKKDLVAYFLASALAVNMLNLTSFIDKKVRYEDGHIVIDRMISVKDTKNYILESEGDITEEQKEYLYNDDFITDVLEVADESRNYILREKLKDIYIIYGDDHFDEEDISGYYSLKTINAIHLKDNSEEIFNYACAHEFVHLMQDNNQYSYILEACAEIMAEEYYDSLAMSYPFQRESLYMLMEVIGPKPIMELNFKGDTSTFENAIYEYLDEEDAKTLLELFTRDPDDEDFNEVRKEINPLIEKMYFNKYHKEINFSNVFSAYTTEIRSYFNQRNSTFYKEYNRSFSEDSKTMSIDEIKDNPDVDNYIYHTYKTISKEEYLRRHTNLEDAKKVYVNYLNNHNIEMVYPDGVVIDGKFYYNDEVEEKDLAELEYREIVEQKLKTFDEVEAADNGVFEVNFKNGGRATFHKYHDVEYSPVHYQEVREIHFDSVADKFPNQLKDESKKIAMEIVNEIEEAGNVVEKIPRRRPF